MTTGGFLSEAALFQGEDEQSRLRLSTLTNTRWLAILGQGIAIVVVASYLQFPFPVVACTFLLALSAFLNLVLIWLFPANQRLGPLSVFMVLVFDVVQLSALLYLTGGLENPFSVLMIVHVVISAATLPVTFTAAVCALVAIMASLLAVWHLPLPWYPDSQLDVPIIFVFGMWGAVISSVLFSAFYIHRVANEARSLANALNEAELVLQREQHLSAIDGLAAAAAHELGTPLATISLVAKEMDLATKEDDALKEDVRLLREQADRCREILSRIATLNTTEEAPISQLALAEMIEEIIAPNRDLGVSISVDASGVGPMPVFVRNPGILYGLGNLAENAVDFARGRVVITCGWTADTVSVEISDDGPGYGVDQLERLGEPDVASVRGPERAREGSEGLGLGIFIAKTLLERTGAKLVFSNGGAAGMGANARVTWPMSSIVIQTA
ncbi:MAG: ActS/PrrB/RegB family redox-sensitive histidine kinase [Pseudomonadota bacterium]